MADFQTYEEELGVSSR